MLNVAIIGSSGAIGGAFVEEFAKRNDVGSIFAFSRTAVNFENEKIISNTIDFENEDSILQCANLASEKLPIDLVIVATGMLHNEHIKPEKSIRDLSKNNLLEVYNANTVVPAIIAKYFLPKLNKNSKSVFACLSAKVASISENTIGGWHAYRASKVALNMILKNCAIELARSNKNGIIASLHPATVDSKLSKPFHAGYQNKIYTPQEAVLNMISVIEKLTPQDSGDFFSHDGTKIGW